MLKQYLGTLDCALRFIVGAALLAGFFLLPEAGYRNWLILGDIASQQSPGLQYSRAVDLPAKRRQIKQPAPGQMVRRAPCNWRTHWRHLHS